MKNRSLTNARARFLVGSTLAAAVVPLGCAASRPALVKAEVPSPIAPAASPIAVQVAKTNAGFQLMRGGKPYFIKGAGGDGSKEALQAAGANSWRTWGADNLDGQLTEAQKLGMTVTIGIWLGHKDQGFNYSDTTAVAAQKEMARTAILRYKDSPALLVWAIGNEMETGGEDDPALWNAVEDIAKMAHSLDPNHPTMTVVAEIGGDKVKQINAHCPDIDIVGLNTYAGGPSIAGRYTAAGGIKPFIVTEYGPPGTWEGQKNAFGVVPELTSTEKAARYSETYTKSIEHQTLCLGSYAFTWGNKQEASATWFGLLLPDGSKLGAVDTLTQLWTGHPAVNLSPAIQSLTLTSSNQAAPGTTVHAALAASDPERATLAVTWILQAEPKAFGTGGVTESAPPTYPKAITASSSTGATVKMPEYGGAYRLYAYVRDGHGGAAVANVPLDVTGDKTPSVALVAPKAALPLTLLGNSAGTPYIPAGYMGNSSAIKMNPDYATHPHSGKTCLQAMYTAGDSWGGVAWQNPDNNWGEKPGGLNLTGAKTLSFWARGEKGGEKVAFSFGLIGKDKPFSDTASGKLDGVTLSRDWTKYTIDLTGKDMSRIVTGFCWVVAGTGSGEVFYLDDIRYE